MINVYQWKTNNGIRTSISVDKIDIELLDDKVIEARDFNKRIQPVSWTMNIKNPKDKMVIYKYSVPTLGFKII